MTAPQQKQMPWMGDLIDSYNMALSSALTDGEGRRRRSRAFNLVGRSGSAPNEIRRENHSLIVQDILGLDRHCWVARVLSIIDTFMGSVKRSKTFTRALEDVGPSSRGNGGNGSLARAPQDLVVRKGT